MMNRTAGLVIATVATAVGGCTQEETLAHAAPEAVRSALSSPADNLTLTTSAAVTARRQNLINFVWGQNTLPTTTAVTETVTGICGSSGPPAVPALPNLSSKTQLRIDMSNDQKAWACHLTNSQPNGRLVILHHGHACGMADNTSPFYDDNENGMHRTVYHLLNEGFGVLYVHMPGFRPGDCANDTGINPHPAMLNLTPPQGSSLQYFLTGTLAALNRVQASYSDINMVGLSGGGWTTSWYAALDTRVKMSFVLSGAMPFQFWPSATVDEQNHAPYYASTGYKDLFLMSSHGDGRRQISVLRRQEGCCFSPSWNVANGQSWANNVHAYESEIRTALANMGSTGMYRLEIDESTTHSHTMSRSTVTNVVLAELQGARRHVGAADSSDAFGRGANGNIWRRATTSWTDTGLASVGVPSVIKVNGVINLFFRNRENQLVRATPSGGGWSTTLLGGTIMSDPSAVSRTAEVWDVIAFGRDYLLYWWSSQFSGAVQVSSTAMGLGTPSLVSNDSTPNALNGYFRGLGNGTYAVSWNGTRWSIDSGLQPGVIRGFPVGAQVTSGIQRVYAFGTGGHLFENSKGAGSWSNWASVSAAASAQSTFLVGSPSTSLAGSGVSARTTANLGLFTLSSTWSFSNQSGSIAGSPTRVPGGSWARSPTNSVSFNNGSSWSSFGGWIE